ncbi:MAG: GNAT family N-acetyltransferase [Actinomycetota bacterium]|jgi:acetyl coenzyme A synthetase (ADP forming)-like protein|nr:GNAT family N-acetyltransferase [Actinomycetota bacterium]
MAAETGVYAHDAVLKDGRTVSIRPIRPADNDLMMDMWQRLSAETIRMRFFAPRSMTVEQMRYFTEVDQRYRVAFVAETAGRIVGVSRFDRLTEDLSTAEFAVLVEDFEQGRGIGTALLRALFEPARDLGVTGFVGDVLRSNNRMLHVLRDAGLEPVLHSYGSVVHTTFRSTSTEAFLATGDEQDRQAAVAALHAVFSPSSIAVVGASRDPRTIGGLVFANLLAGGYAGPVYPVNPSAAHVQSVAAYATVADCPTVPEMVLVCVPAAHVITVVEQAAELGTKAAVIISAGFNEAGPEGATRERELMQVVRSRGIRVVGPNCMGVLNAGGDVRMNGTFSQVFPPPGRVAFSSQSGALGLAILAAAQRLGLGLSSFASIGNKADLSGNDLLQYWESDAATEVILLYLESFGNPRKFGRIARRIGRSKPIVAVKSGRSAAGERAASSHTGALAAGDVAVDALFRQAGVIRTDTLEEMFNVATVLTNQPVPTGDRVAILTNGGGPGILAADACEANGLAVPELSEATLSRLAEFLPTEAGIRNPVDMIASASAANYGRAMRALADDPQVDVLLVIFIPPVVTLAEDVAREMAAARTEIDPGIPVVSVFMSERGVPEELAEARIPSFRFPEGAAQALGSVARYGRWRTRPLGNVVEVRDADEAAARAVVDESLPSGASSAWLDATQAERLLAAFGITTARAQVVHTPEEAAAVQAEIGGPVAVKAAAPIHKTELGGVRLGLARPEQVADAVRQISADLEAAQHGLVDAGFLVQEMVGDGVEMVVGVSHDSSFGPILLVGMGGTLVELLSDVAVRIHPLTDVDVDDMLTSLRGYPLLTGYRGSPPVDIAALKALLFRVSAMIEAVPEVDEADLNPVFVRRRGIAAVDARIKLSREHARPRR